MFEEDEINGRIRGGKEKFVKTQKIEFSSKDKVVDIMRVSGENQINPN